MKQPILILLLFLLFANNSYARSVHKAVYGTSNNKLVYAADNRQEVDEHVDKRLRDYAQSVAVMVPNIDLKPNANLTEFSFDPVKISVSQNLCPGEKYAEQPTLGICTGFLVAEDIILTAGHCFASQADCRKYQWVFDFKKDINKFNRKQVYGCQKIIKLKNKETYFRLKDYALVKLKKKTGRIPLPFRKTGKVKKNTPIAVIGYPLGIPAKIANGAKVQKHTYRELLNPLKLKFKKKYYFNADIDVYVGNSGSPIININTGLVEGLLSYGNEDFKKNKKEDCIKTSVRKANRRHRTETIFRITKVKELLQLQNM